MQGHLAELDMEENVARGAYFLGWIEEVGCTPNTKIPKGIGNRSCKTDGGWCSQIIAYQWLLVLIGVEHF
jgi:hypothetical protein